MKCNGHASTDKLLTLSCNYGFLKKRTLQKTKEGNETFSKYLTPNFPTHPTPAKPSDKQLGQSPISMAPLKYLHSPAAILLTSLGFLVINDAA